MFFDAHGDILTHIADNLKQGKDVWENYHLNKYKKGKIKSSIFVNFTNPNNATQKNEFEDITKLALPYVKNHKSINILGHNANPQKNKINVLLGIEGLNALNNEKDLYTLYKHGYRHIGITWNEKNQFASGSLENGGLTKKGEKLIKIANELSMIVDYAHLNKESFFDIAKITTKPIFVSHANINTLCEHPRNLNDDQLALIQKREGIVGLTALDIFLNNDNNKATIDNLIDQIDYVKKNFTIDIIGFGFDFCYYLKGEKENNVKNLEDISCVPKIIKSLKARNYKESEIKKICFLNMERVIKKNLIK